MKFCEAILKCRRILLHGLYVNMSSHILVKKKRLAIYISYFYLFAKEKYSVCNGIFDKVKFDVVTSTCDNF